MSNSRLQKQIIRVASILIVLAIVIGIFMTFFQARAVEKQIREFEESMETMPSDFQDKEN